jgi:prepilin-type N-terminal cleavage/methylation domain-containing protein
MVYGSSVNKGYKGMRKGISLVEMLIAIVLFGVLAAMSFKYVKNFYDTEVATKQARIAALIEQGTQLTNAYDIYTMKYGTAPATLAILHDDKVKILTQKPTTIKEIGTAGWAYTQAADLATGANGAIAGGSDTAYYFDLLANEDSAKYCAVINNIADNGVTTSLVADATTAFISATYYKTGDYSNFYCVGTDATGVGPYRIFFVK